MQIYVGTDIAENERIKKAVERLGNRFLNRVYTQKELEYCLNKKTYVQCLAARFAAKEAAIKVYYQAFRKTLRLQQIEILGKTGEPAEILLHLPKKPEKPFNITLSLAHEKSYSIATVIIYL